MSIAPAGVKLFALQYVGSAEVLDPKALREEIARGLEEAAKISLLKSARLVQTPDADRRVYLLAGPDAEQPGVLQDLVLKLHLAARMAGRKDCPKEEFSCVLPLDVEGAAAEILEE